MKTTAKFVMVILSAILLLSLATNAYLYFSLNNRLQSEKADLESQVANLQMQLDNLQNRKGNLVTALGATYTWSPNSNGDRVYYLYIQGTVTNEGNGTAYNCDLKIVTNSLKDSFTDYYKFNALAPGEHVDIDTHIFHVDLVNWTITPEWTNSP